MPSLFDPIRLGAIEAPNRILMAPLTRGRATSEHVPAPIMAEYYAQRAGAGLILSEATGITQEGLGWPYAPGIWSDAQVDAWRPIVKAVHDRGGKIVCQIWHMGRMVHPDFLGGAKPVSSSATTAPDAAHTYKGKQPYAEARALELDEIPRLLADYERAAGNARAAGFDGVQIHAANGYLIDQFLRDGTNRRRDSYGGTVANRARLLLEVLTPIAKSWPSEWATKANDYAIQIHGGGGMSDDYAGDAEAEQNLADLKALLDDVNIEDRGCTEKVYRGLCADGAEPGHLSHLERPNFDFAQYLMNRIDPSFTPKL